MSGVRKRVATSVEIWIQEGEKRGTLFQELTVKAEDILEEDRCGKIFNHRKMATSSKKSGDDTRSDRIDGRPRNQMKVGGRACSSTFWDGKGRDRGQTVGLVRRGEENLKRYVPPGNSVAKNSRGEYTMGETLLLEKKSLRLVLLRLEEDKIQPSGTVRKSRGKEQNYHEALDVTRRRRGNVRREKPFSEENHRSKDERRPGWLGSSPR